jgi:energy-coupling factor transporter ATP-binding protein EcfA2
MKRVVLEQALMFIREIHIEKFRHLKDVHLGPFGQPPDQSDLIVLAGPNGGGKSSILELLGKALSDSWSLNWSLRRTFEGFSFEVAIGVTPEERSLVRRYIHENNRSYAADVTRYFQENGVYYRAYNYQGGRYHENSNLHNKIHEMVTESLRNHYNRSLGFFLKSDRHYPPEAFKRDRLFQYDSVTKRDHIWSMAFSTSDVQYKDMFEFLLQLRYHYFRELGAYHHRRGKTMPVGERTGPPTDPLQPYDELLQRLFPGYSFAETEEIVPTNLFIRIPSEDVIPFQDLSSGEKEVFFLLSFFFRHNVTNAVVVIDEPELHLHPELGRLLIRTMQRVKTSNQIWLATHNAEIIDEAGRDRVIYIASDPDTKTSRVTHGSDEAEAIKHLKDLFGYSGYMGIARNMVFLEGQDSSSDRKVFSSLFPQQGGKLKFIPAKSSDNMSRLNAAILAILESNLGWMQFYLIRDRDYLTPDAVKKYKENLSGRIHVLERHEIENYLLDPDLIAEVQKDIFGKPTTPDEVNRRLRQIARRLFGEALRDMISFRLNLIYRPQDFSLGNFFKGQSVVDGNGIADPAKIALLSNQIVGKTTTINGEMAAATSQPAIEQLVASCRTELEEAIKEGGADNWRLLFPGKQLLEEYAKGFDLGKPPVLENTLIKQLAARPERIPSELRQVVDEIVAGRPFSP